MIDFNDVRKTNEKTYFFFSLYRHEALVFGLKSAGIANYEIIKLSEAKHRLPAGYEVPEVRVYPGAPDVEKRVLVMVSRYDTDDLERKLGQIESGPEFKAAQKAYADKVLEIQDDNA